ncbi:hypothetical protein NLG97_g7016 [Lecanicillium saksenae]|uniref:Uncharacterized protein n=1 Tax=Lecanicillium saksenae TaxID=468837 RepID=A0ACC1QQC0_9HYPO|nr:hypothetical protein NLG97_g7016 [Lecanicillium saksenae]
MTPTIAILGGGPSGLALACLLQLNNIDFVVYERNAGENTDEQGGSLDIHGTTGQLVLKQAGLTEEFEAKARREGSAAVLYDKMGNKLLNFGEERDAPEIDRRELRRLLVNSLEAGNIKWGKAVKAVTKDDQGEVSISFTDGTLVSGFKLVVGADGAWSRVRQLLTAAKPIYSGKHYLESRISTTNPFHATVKAKVGAGVIIAVGSFKHIAVMCMGDGSYRVYLALSVPEDFFTSDGSCPVSLVAEDGAIARRYFVSEEEYFSGWSQDLRDIIASCEGPFRRWPLYHMPTESLSWESVTGVTLVGDAAHLSTPFVGEGVNCALFDSLQLANLIVEHGTSTDALNRAVVEYEKDMFERGQSLIERSNASSTLLFAEDPVELMKMIQSASQE